MVKVFGQRGVRQKEELGVPGNSGEAKSEVHLILGYCSLDPYACYAPDHHQYISISWLQRRFE